jgi:oligopeptide/dipeptide ABC transporter ATP-binding protein
VVEEAPVEPLFSSPHMPYTEGLLRAMPRLDDGAPSERLSTIAGTVPSPDALPSGCTFRDRCPYAWERCAREEPALHQVGAAHRVRCHLVQEPERRVPTAAGARA